MTKEEGVEEESLVGQTDKVLLRNELGGVKGFLLRGLDLTKRLQ